MKKLAIGLILILAIALLAPTPAMAKKADIPEYVHHLRVDATIATETYEDTTFEVNAVQIDETGNAIGFYRYTVTNTASGRKSVEVGVITAMRVFEDPYAGTVVVVGGLVLASPNTDLVGDAFLAGFTNNPDEATSALHYAVSTPAEVLELVNTIVDEDPFIVTTDLVPIDTGYVVLKPKT